MNKEELNNAMLAHITEALGYAELHEEFKTKIMKAVSHFMPFVCTATERMFLDEIREKLSIEIIPFTMGKEICIQAGNTRIHQANFGTNLKELVNE